MKPLFSIVLAGLFVYLFVNTAGPTVTYTNPVLVETAEAHESSQPPHPMPSAESLAVVFDETETIVAPHEIVLSSVSAYTSSVDETDDTPGVNAMGTKPGPGSIACPTRYPFGTEVIIKNQSYFCDDRMNPRYANSDHFDIWMATKNEAIHWGRRVTEVTIIK